MKTIGRAFALLALLGCALTSPAFASDPPLVIESGKTKQLPAGTSLQLRAPTTSNASINLPHGTAPTTPTNGDCWTTTGGLYCQINGSTVGPMGSGGGGTITLSGDVSGSGTSAITTAIGSNKVTRGMLAQTSGARLLGATSAANVSDLTGTQATTLLDVFTTSLKGLAPASGGGTTNFLRADGTWAAPSGGSLPSIGSGDVLGNASASSATASDTTLTALLDRAFGSTQGALLYRGSSAWLALPAGTSGQVLRTNGSAANPSWSNVGGGGTTGGNSLAWPVNGTGSASATLTATHGTLFTVLSDFTVSGLWAITTTVSGATYRVSIYQVNGSNVITAVIADSADIASPGAVTGANVGSTFSAVTLAAGGTYVAAFRRTDATDATAVGVFGLSTTTLPDYTGLPITFTSTLQTKFVTLAKANPAVGDSFSAGSAGYYSIGVLFSAN